MKEIMLKLMWPQVAIAVLFAVLAVLTLLSRRSDRGGSLHRARLAVLAALVSLTVGAAVGCGSRTSTPQPNDQPGPGTTVDGQQPPPLEVPTCYAPMPTCYEPMVVPDQPPPQPRCYAPRPLPPETPPLPPPDVQPMCYAPMEVPSPPPPAGGDDQASSGQGSGTQES